MRWLIGSMLVLVLLGGVWWLAATDEPAPAPGTDGGEGAAAVLRSPAAPATAPARDGTAASGGEPSFRQRLRTFVAEAPELTEAQRHAEADALRRDTLAREAEGALLPAESAYIQLALLRATITDEAQLRRRSEALLERYETASAQGWADYRNRTAPRHDAYREAESELIRRAREENVSDDELRERLQALREQYDE